MDEFSGEGLFILAAVVIAFVNWLSNTLKQRAAARDAAERRARGELPEEEHEQHGAHDDSSWPELDESPAPSQRRSVADPNQEIRNFFEALSGGQATQPQPQPTARVQVQTPPPVPSSQEQPPAWSERKVERPQLSAAERAALHRVERQQDLATQRGLHARKAKHPVIDLLRKEGGARQAIVLVEILGKPKALAEPDPIQ